MPLHLTIENQTSLPHGGPLRYTLSGTHRLDIGRDPYLEWSLPDPTVSSRHCEIRFREGGYWLNDVSRNGTFVNQTTQRVQEPCRLRTGDRVYVGQYIIRVEIDGEAEARPEPSALPPAYGAGGGDTWADNPGAPPPIDRNGLVGQAQHRPLHEGFPVQPIDMPIVPGHDRASPQHGYPGYPVQEPRAEPPPAWPEPAGGHFPHWTDPPGMDDRPRVVPPYTNGPLQGPVPPVSTHQVSTPAGERDNPWGQPTLGKPPGEAPRPAFGFDSRGASGPRGPEAPPASAGADEFVRRFAKGAGIPAETLAWRDPGEFAEDLGALTRLVADGLKQLLAARTETKRIVRVSSHTTIQSVGNNPLKFSPTVDDALQIMFGRPSRSYLAAHDALEDGLRDAKAHQKKVFEAMRDALRLLLKELDPEEIEDALSEDRGLGSLLGSRKARLWDLYATRWAALTSAHEEGMVDAFMVYFSDSYDGRK